MDGSPRSLSPRPSFPSMSGPLSTEASSCPLPLLVLLGKSARSQHTGVPGRCAAPAHHCRPGDLVGPRGVQRHPPPHVLDAEAAEERPPLADGRAALRPHPCPVSSFPANTSPRPEYAAAPWRPRQRLLLRSHGPTRYLPHVDLTGMYSAQARAPGSARSGRCGPWASLCPSWSSGAKKSGARVWKGFVPSCFPSAVLSEC